MRMETVTSRCTRERLAELAAENYGAMIKGVVDVGRGALVLGGELQGFRQRMRAIVDALVE